MSVAKHERTDVCVLGDEDAAVDVCLRQDGYVTGSDTAVGDVHHVVARCLESRDG